MPEPTGLTKQDWLREGNAEGRMLAPEMEMPAQKLAVVSPPANRALQRDVARTSANLSNVFSQLTGLQHQIAEQMMVLERCLQQQQDDVAVTTGALPDLRDRINWLIASHYDQSKKNEAIREKFGQVDSDISALRLAQECRTDRLQAELDERTRTLSERMDAISARQATQESQLAEWKAPVEELGRKLNALAEELKRHDANFSSVAQSVRSLCEVQNHWKTVLTQMVEVLIPVRSVAIPEPPVLL